MVNENRIFEAIGTAHQSRFDKTIELVCESGCDQVEAYKIASMWDFFPYLTPLEEPVLEREFKLLYALAQDIDSLNFVEGDSELEEVINFFATCEKLHKKVNIEDFQFAFTIGSKWKYHRKPNMELFRMLVETILENRLRMFDRIIKTINSNELKYSMTVEDYRYEVTYVSHFDIVERSSYKTQWGE